MSYFNAPTICYFMMLVSIYSVQSLSFNPLAASPQPTSNSVQFGAPLDAASSLRLAASTDAYDPGQVGQPVQTGGSGGRWVAIAG